MSRTNEDAFLANIRARPHDDAPRLIFADWLEERGRKGDSGRAEFIRVQCAIPRIPRDKVCLDFVEGRDEVGPRFWLAEAPHRDGSCEFCRLRCREEELLADFPVLTSWFLAPHLSWRRRQDYMPGWLILEGDGLSANVRRGFVDELHCEVADWCRYGAAIHKLTPLSTLRLTDAGTASDLSSYSVLETFAGLPCLELEGYTGVVNPPYRTILDNIADHADVLFGGPQRMVVNGHLWERFWERQGRRRPWWRWWR
jgi:uncharacterized protein (TIGR02996 family)